MRQDDLAMLVPTLKELDCRDEIGDDIASMKFGDDGKLYAVNPEYQVLQHHANTAAKTNADAMDTIGRDTIFADAAKTDDSDIWWEKEVAGETPTT